VGASQRTSSLADARRPARKRRNIFIGGRFTATSKPQHAQDHGRLPVTNDFRTAGADAARQHVCQNGSVLNILLIDNFDSFSFNLVDELRKRGGAVEVWRNDIAASRALEIAVAMPAPRMIVLSPGPGAPADAGCCVELIRAVEVANDVSLFGVCLGHQAIVEALGGEVGFAGEVVHGKAARVSHDGTGMFAGLPSPMFVARYHSLAAKRLPPSLRVTARIDRAGDEDEGLVMAVEHLRAKIAGVQFHPESILTPRGGELLDRVVSWAAEAS
jgi:anthranilate synthase/aminodeoxychorismate synthase-like glutamine amidotransferase